MVETDGGTRDATYTKEEGSDVATLDVFFPFRFQDGDVLGSRRFFTRR